MACDLPAPVYANQAIKGLGFAGSNNDGYINLRWTQAYSDRPSLSLLYNVYYSTLREDVFTEGVKFVVLDNAILTAQVNYLTPGDLYYFAVRAALYDPVLNAVSQLPLGTDGIPYYPEGMLLADITDSDMLISVSDINLFPNVGIVQIGAELIYYIGKDIPNDNLIVSSRGYYGSLERLHTTDGYDGYRMYTNPFVRYFVGFEDQNQSIVSSEVRFFETSYAWTETDGYATLGEDLITTDLTSTEETQEGFPAFDHAGWRRTDPELLLAGKCVGSYYGGEYGCIDGYGNFRRVRGLSIEEINNQRQEELLQLTGEPVVLVRRLWQGVRCPCVSSSRETPEHRCTRCYGTGFLTGYDQYFNSRRSDGRILIRFSPAVEDFAVQEPGVESDYKPNAWSLSVPIIKDRDFFIRFNKDGTEEFRYEVINVTRNKILLNNYGQQQLSLVRVRKTDPIYQWAAIRDTSTMPVSVTTSVGFAPGIPPHVHHVVLNENILNLGQITQTTDVANGHNHTVRNGVVLEYAGHIHTIVL